MCLSWCCPPPIDSGMHTRRFMIDMYRSLYLCLLDLAVHGSITVLV